MSERIGKSRAEILDRYRKGLALEKKGLNYSQISAAIGYKNEDSYRKLKQKIEMKGVYAKTVSKNRGDTQARYEEGMLLEAKGLSEAETAYKLGYTWASSWRQLKARMGEPKAKPAQPDIKPDEKIDERIYQLGRKALIWLSPKIQCVETAITILDLMVEARDAEK